MTTFAVLRDTVQKWLLREGEESFNDAFSVILTMTEGRLRHDFRLSQTLTTVNVSDLSTNRLALPDDMLQLVGVSVVSGSREGGYDLMRVPLQVLRRLPEWGDADSAGAPGYYAVEGNDLIFAPNPSEASISISYYPVLPGIEDAGTNSLLSNGFHIVASACMAESAAYLQDLDLYKFYDARYTRFKEEYMQADRNNREPAPIRSFSPGGP